MQLDSHTSKLWFYSDLLHRAASHCGVGQRPFRFTIESSGPEGSLTLTLSPLGEGTASSPSGEKAGMRARQAPLDKGHAVWYTSRKQYRAGLRSGNTGLALKQRVRGPEKPPGRRPANACFSFLSSGSNGGRKFCRVRRHERLMSLIEEVAKAVEELREEEARRLVDRALADKVDPDALLREGILVGMRRIGERFQSGDYFLAELTIGGDLGKECVGMVTPHLPKTSQKRGKVVIATVKGDVHNIGKDLVAMQLETAGFEVHNMGVNLPTMEIIQKAKEVNADIIGLSAFLSSTIPYTAELVRYLVDLGLRERFKIIIGGTGTSNAYAQSIGADGWARDCFEAVELCEELVC